MDQLFDLAAWREIFVRALSELSVNVANFLPHLVGALFLLGLGWLLARVLEAVSARGLRAAGLDRAAARLHLVEVLERAEIRLTFSRVVARLIFWLVFLVFLLSSIEALGLTAVTATLDRLIAFIPSVIGAALIAVGGLLLARFTAALVTSSAAAFGVVSTRRLGVLTQGLVGGLALVVALQQLGVATDLLLVPFSVALGAAALSFGLALALGARPVITHILAGHFLKQSLPREAPVEIDGRRGFIERVGAVDTLLRDGEARWSVPNAQLLERTVLR